MSGEIHISSEWELASQEPLHYEKISMSADGYILITDSLRLEIDELINLKGFSDIRYEFLIQAEKGENGDNGENGKNAGDSIEVNIVIHSLNKTIHIKSLGGRGGDGGNGTNGGDGGDGGDGGTGGNGGNGGNGTNGGNGGNGGAAPRVKITFASTEEDADIVTLTKEDSPSDEKTSYGGSGGQRGAGGKGGKGGKGGRNENGFAAPAGKRGTDGKFGKPGKNGDDADIVIIREKGE